MSESKPTPMMVQYLETKSKYPDCLLFYRMGDFYEMFFEDAIKASKTLGIVLTYRGKNLGEPIPMCGVPFHAYENYLVRLVKAGYKVAICEQTESPAEAKKRGAASVVRRDVIRVVTAGTLTEDNLLNARRHNYLACVAEGPDRLGVAWVDMSTGDFFSQEIPVQGVISVLARLEASEVILSDDFIQKYPHVWDDSFGVLTTRPGSDFSMMAVAEHVKKHVDFSKVEQIAMGVLLKYIDETQKGALPNLLPPQRIQAVQFMDIDASTRRSLELTSTLSDDRHAHSLLDVLDETLTGAGARMLGTYLSSPLLDLNEINARLDRVAFFVDNPFIRDEVRALLKEVPDVERALSRLAVGRGGPRDMLCVVGALDKIPALRTRIQAGFVPASLNEDKIQLGDHTELVDDLLWAVRPDAPLLPRDGGFIKEGFSAPLDEILQTKTQSKRILAELQAKYVADTGISNLKITFNNLLGYFVEVPARAAEPLLVEKDRGFIHRQTMVNAVRFTTVELSDLETKIMHADERALALELEIFEQLRERILVKSDDILASARAMARIDVAAGLAWSADRNHWTRPVLTNGTDFIITGGRHPVVECALQKDNIKFVPNDCTLGQDENNLWLLTGPNMAGKSTFLRQNALIVVMAQIGCFVPAQSATIGLVDRLFSRVGASDDLARGRSTFMVEMVEVAAILKGATERSLVILDEVGRGTATFDGLSLAWAVVEYLHDHNKSRGLFATHYHELTALAARLPGVTLHTMRIKEWQGDIVFLHEVGDGAVDKSYGIHVAKLAGLPEPVLMRASQVLEQLEEKKQAQKPLFDELPLFSSVAHPTYINNQDSAVVNALQETNIDLLSPREALDMLYQLKEKIREIE